MQIHTCAGMRAAGAASRSSKHASRRSSVYRRHATFTSCRKSASTVSRVCRACCESATRSSALPVSWVRKVWNNQPSCC